MNRKNLNKEIDFHDAILKTFIINSEKREVTVALDLYKNINDSQRIAAIVKFLNVTSITASCNLFSLQKNSIAGNVNYWSPGNSKQSTYIYLIDGYMEIVAGEVNLVFGEN